MTDRLISNILIILNDSMPCLWITDIQFHAILQSFWMKMSLFPVSSFEWLDMKHISCHPKWHDSRFYHFIIILNAQRGEFLSFCNHQSFCICSEWLFIIFLSFWIKSERLNTIFLSLQTNFEWLNIIFIILNLLLTILHSLTLISSFLHSETSLCQLNCITLPTLYTFRITLHHSSLIPHISTLPSVQQDVGEHEKIEKDTARETKIEKTSRLRYGNGKVLNIYTKIIRQWINKL